MSGSDITPEILKTIDILEVLEAFPNKAPTSEVKAILQEAWIKVIDTPRRERTYCVHTNGDSLRFHQLMPPKSPMLGDFEQEKVSNAQNFQPSKSPKFGGFRGREV